MATRIKGVTVYLHEKTEKGLDPFNQPIYDYVPTPVHNVIVAPATDQEILDSINLYGKKAVYTLGLPKGDCHDWSDTKVEIFGKEFKTFGFVEEGIEAMVPLDWHKKVKVERYG